MTCINENAPVLTILCDTSYLMSSDAEKPGWVVGDQTGSDLVFLSTHKNRQNSDFTLLPWFQEFNHTSYDYEPLSLLHSQFRRFICDSSTTFATQTLIPTGVKKELAKHFKDPEKEQQARRARIILAEILAGNGYSEVDLDDIDIPKMKETDLGPDSKFDKQLISYAIQMANEGKVVYIATEDGGIMLECVNLLKNQGLNIFTKATRTKCEVYHKTILEHFQNAMPEWESEIQSILKRY